MLDNRRPPQGNIGPLFFGLNIHLRIANRTSVMIEENFTSTSNFSKFRQCDYSSSSGWNTQLMLITLHLSSTACIGWMEIRFNLSVWKRRNPLWVIGNSVGEKQFAHSTAALVYLFRPLGLVTGAWMYKNGMTSTGIKIAVALFCLFRAS